MPEETPEQNQSLNPKTQMRNRPKGRRRADLPFDEYIKKKLDRIDATNEQEERKRTQTWATLIKRYRGDHFGFFASDNSGKWIEVNATGLKKINIIAPIVRSNNTNWIAAPVQLEITPATDNPEKAGGTEIAQSIITMLSERDWNETLEEMISELAQLCSGYYIRSKYNKNAGPKMRVPRMSPKDIEIEAKYTCVSCHQSGPATEAEAAGGCPACGGPATISDPMQMPGMEIPDGYDEMQAGENETHVVSPFEMKVDERNGAGGDLTKCRWIRHSHLAYRNEIEELRPWASLDGTQKEWTEGVKQQRALETSSGTGFSQGNDQEKEESDEDLLEMRLYWLDRKALAGYIAPDDYKHQCGFKILEGQRIEDVWPDEFEGLFVERSNGEITFFDNEDKNKTWTYGQFQMDATSFNGKAQEDLLDLQEMVIEMVNIFFQAGMTSSTPPLIIDGMLFDGEDFANDPGSVVYTRKGYDREKPISHYIHQLFPQMPGGEMFNFWNLLLQSAQDTSGVQPAAVGAPDPSAKGVGDQLMKRQAAVSLMIPSQKSKAKAKKEWAAQQLELVQKNWDSSRYVPIKTKYGEEWKEADVEAFRNADIRRDFNIRYVEGTEIPQTLMEKEMKLSALLSSGMLENPNIPLQLKSMLLRMAGVDYDLENFEAEIRLAKARFKKIKERVELANQQGLLYAIGPSGAPMIDDLGNPMVDTDAALMLLNSPGVRIIPESDAHQIHAEFYADQLKSIAAKEVPDDVLIEVLRLRIKEHGVGLAGQAAQTNQLQLMAQAPMMEAQATAQDAAQQQQTEQEEAKADNQMAREMVAEGAKQQMNRPAPPVG